jgi:transcriptional regulator with XRE-family HTH domain
MIRKNLLYYRKKVKKKSLDEMSSDIKISRDTLNRLENNDDAVKPLFPNLKTLIAITEYFEVNIADFISIDFEMMEAEKIGILDSGYSMGIDGVDYRIKV